MDSLGQSHRSDEQLEAILFETGRWAVNGQHGQVLGYAASLEHAVKRSASFSLSGARVIAICQLPFDNIVIFPEQIGRLRRAVRTLSAYHRQTDRPQAKQAHLKRLLDCRLVNHWRD